MTISETFFPALSCSLRDHHFLCWAILEHEFSSFSSFSGSVLNACKEIVWQVTAVEHLSISNMSIGQFERWLKPGIPFTCLKFLPLHTLTKTISCFPAGWWCCGKRNTAKWIHQLLSLSCPATKLLRTAPFTALVTQIRGEAYFILAEFCASLRNWRNVH